MNPNERMLAAIRGDPIDRVPLDPAGFSYATEEELDRCRDPRRHEIARRLFGETAVFRNQESYANVYMMTPHQRIRTTEEDLGGGRKRLLGRIDTPKGPLTFANEYNPDVRTWWRVKSPLETMEDIDRIRSLPWELPEGLAAPDGSHLTEDFRRRGILQTRVGSPAARVCSAMPYEWFLELLLTERGLILELTEMMRQRALDLLGVLLSRPGVEYVGMGGSESVTPPMASPELYDELIQEQERSIIDFVHSKGRIPVHIHCHGHVRHALKRCVERGVDYTEPVEPPPDGDVTMAEARELVGDRLALGGNVECRLLCNGSEEDVERAVRAAFEGGKRRFVLRPTEGPSPELTEREFRNYMRMIDVWEELSPVG